MPATLTELVSDRSLGLRPACPSADLDREVSWAHSSELADPTRYLDGGELLLTTGLPIRATDPAAYAGRLAAHGLAGLGFGVGLGWATIPAALAEACERVRLPGRGVLAVGRSTPFSPADTQVVGSAVSVLTLLHARGTAVARAERDLRGALLELMLTAPGTGAADIAEPLWGRPPGAGAHALALRRRDGRTDDLLDALEGRDRRPPFAAARGDAVLVLAEPGESDAVLRAAATWPDVHAGVSDPIAGDPSAGGATPGRTPVGQAVDQAVHALDAAHRRHLPVVRFGELAGAGLHELVPAGDAAGFAESLLRPLVRHDEHRRGELVESVRAWLTHHGQWDPAATALGVHRHTLRTRIDKAARLLDRDLDSPGVRAELWFALQV